MFRAYVLVVLGLLFSTNILSSSGRRWLPILHVVKNPTGTVSSGIRATRNYAAPTIPSTQSQVNISVPGVSARESKNVSKTTQIVAVVKGECLDTEETTLPPKPTCPTAVTCPKACTREICRFTLPALATNRKFMIGIHHKEKPAVCGYEICCHPGGGLPKHPGDFQGTGAPHDRTYQRALSGELAEKIVDKIFKKSVERGNPIINPITSTDKLKDLTRILHGSTLEREGCCYKLSGELRCFLAFLLLQRPARRKRSCGCMMATGNENVFASGQSGYTAYSKETNINGGERHIRPKINLSSVQLPVSFYGFQPPPLLNLP